MKKRNVKIIIYLTALVCIISLSYHKFFTKENKNIIDNNYIGAYIDGKYTNTIPAKGSVVFDHVECDNGATATWNNDSWGLLTTGITKRTKCNLYFKVPVINKIMANLDTTGKCPTVNGDGSVKVTAAETESGYLCGAPDAYGTSYYFRGNVTNNYVYFAGYYWRILRVNGDGTIRIIYDGTSPHVNNEASDDRQIGTSVFNNSDWYHDNAYIGYMYGQTDQSDSDQCTPDGPAPEDPDTPVTESTEIPPECMEPTYEQAHANINNSDIKQYVDSWHEQHIKTNFSSYLADNIFCDDRSFSPNNKGTGAGMTSTYYRWWTPGYNMILTCPQKNDAFTVNDIVHGNGALTYPVGLLSADEVVLAGAANGTEKENPNNFLHTGIDYWTLTPIAFEGFSYIHYVRSTGNLFPSYAGYYEYGVRPVYNLKADALKSGDGTMENPFTVTP